MAQAAPAPFKEAPPQAALFDKTYKTVKPIVTASVKNEKTV